MTNNAKTEAPEFIQGTNIPLSQTLRAAIPHIIFLAGIFYLNFLSRIILAPLMPTIEKGLSINHTEAGSFFFFITFGYCASMLFSGFINERITHKSTIVLSGLGIGLTLLTLPFFPSYRMIIAYLTLLGLFTGLYLPSGIASITHLVTPENWGKAFSIHEWAPNLGFITAPLWVELFLKWTSWRGVFLIIGSLTVVVSLSFFKFGKGGTFRGQAPNFSILKTLFANRSFWIMIFIFGIGIGGTFGIYSMLPLYLVAERGFDKTWINTIIGISRISSLFMTLVAGWLTDKIGPKKAIGIIFASSGITTIFLGLLRGDFILPLIFLQPVFSTCFFPAGFAAVSKITADEIRNVTVSLTVPFGFLFGGGMIPAMIGFAGDLGSFGMGICAVGVVTLGSLLALYFLKFHEDIKGSLKNRLY